MDIAAHIRELLFGHDCVIIPGFGGFIGNYNPARIDKTNFIFNPPVKKISFNRNLTHNDGLLIKKISGSTGMNYGDTRSIIEGYVTDLKKKLERGEKIVFEHIGTFVNNHEGNVQFEPEENVNYLLDSFGFEPFQCRPIEGYDIRKRLSGVQPDIRQKHLLRKYLWRAAVIIPLAGAIIAVSLKTDLLKTRVEAGTLNPLASAEFEHNKAAVDESVAKSTPVFIDSSDTGSSVKDDTGIAGSQPVNISDAGTAGSEKVAAITEKNNYYIITGSFQSEENAVRQMGLLQAEGFNPDIVPAGNGFFRVCAMECPDLQTAVSRKDSILKKFPGAWVSRKK